MAAHDGLEFCTLYCAIISATLTIDETKYNYLSSLAFLGFIAITDYGRPMKPFFHRNPKLLGFGRQFGQINFGAFEVFSANLSAPILVL